MQRENKNILEGLSPRRDLNFLEFIYLFHSYRRVYFQLVAFVKEHIWHKALLMGYSMRLELTRVCSLNYFQLLMSLYRSHPLFFLECVYLSLLYPSFIFDMFLSLCVCVCVCVCVGVVLDFTNSYFSSVCVCECGSWTFFVCMCGSVVWNLLVTIFYK